MIVRLHLQEPVPVKRTPTARWLEFTLLFIGLLGIDSYIWVSVESAYRQAFDNYAIDQQLSRRTPSLPGFLAHEIGILDENQPAQTEPEQPQPAKVLPKSQDLIGRIEIPRLQLSASVREGVDDSTLRIAVGHMPSSALPGTPGNVALAAHRDTLFRKLQDIQKNDRIKVETTNGAYDYVVESLSVVKPTDVSVLRAGQGDQLLTLITCYPFNYVGAAPNRFIVKARQISLTAKALPRA